MQYKYELGVVTRTQNPTPAGQTQGAIKTFEYDAAGRPSRINNVNNGAYRRWVYGSSGHVSTFDTVQSGSPEAYSAVVYDGAGRVRATGGDNPGSSGGFRGQFTLYDVMGRPSQSSNPEEINSGWAPAGDDAAGWVWTTQAYDWKGRPTVMTNPDGTTKEATYGGCGCAGGEVVTMSDEGTLLYSGGPTTRRQHKIYSDVLGRPFKTQVLNWDGTVYSTSVTSYNARDQVTNVKQYQGTDASGVYQESWMTYDGHGRLSTSHVPEQRDQNNLPLTTSYTYWGDDTINVVTDARGATTTYGYNNRRLITAITYTAPSGVTNASAVTLSYDAAGNRTGMTDGMGSISYQYDQLSRLSSETRSFTNVGSFTLSYAYNLAGGLTSVTDQWGVQAGYGYDHTGRLTGVTGSGGGATTYASNMQYRAWGALKHMTYGNNLNLDLAFNNRLQATLYDLKTQAGARVMGREYSYGPVNDGRVKYSHDLVSSNLDRTFTFNHTGQLNSAKAGVPQNNGSYYSGPFEQGYTKDVWGNLTGRTWRTFQTTWTPYGTYTYPQQNSYNESYVNNRNTATGWLYDAEGNLLTSTGGGQTLQYTYDSAGMLRTSTAPGKNITQDFDGDGQRARFAENSTVTYYVRSSMLGGQPITEVNQYGAKVRGYVYAGGAVLAKQEGSQVLWDQRDVSGISMRLTNSSGTVTSKVETDPLGTQVDDTANYNYSGGGGGGFNPNGFYGTPTNPNTGCTLGGMAMSCSQAMRLVESRAYDRRELVVGNSWSLQNMFAQMGNPLVAISGRTEFYVRQQGQQNGVVTYGDQGMGALANQSYLLHERYLASFGYFWIGGAVTDGGSSPGRFLSHSQQSRSQNPFEWTTDERAKRDKAIETALAVLTSNPKCEEFLRGDSDSAFEMLRKMGDSNIGFLNRSQTRPKYDDGSQDIAWTRMTMGVPLMHPQVDLYAAFFDRRREFGLNEDQTRALTILHELGHVTYKYFHSRVAEKLGLGKNMSNAQVDKAIYDKCFGTSPPRGTTE